MFFVYNRRTVDKATNIVNIWGISRFVWEWHSGASPKETGLNENGSDIMA